MAKFNIGDSVIYVNSEEKGIVVKVFPSGRGRQLYTVNINNESKNCLESNLIPDTDLSDPFERVRKGIFGSFLDFSKINTSFKIQNTSKNTISSLKASNTIFKAYQFKPLLKFLNSDNNRILVADEVGLGKTIEAGHIMLELMARKELKNSLIVCPKSLQEKWQTELKEKFNFNFKIYDSLADLKSDLSTLNGTLKGIVNYEKIRLPRVKQKKGEKVAGNSLYDVIEEVNFKFDFVLCDEAHRIRNATTQTHRGAKKLMEVTKSAVFLTATPIMISEENLFNLLQLLDEQKYSEYSTFQNQIAVNRPFIKALTQVNNKVEFHLIASELENTEVTVNYSSGEEYETHFSKTETIQNLFKDIPLYQKIIKVLREKDDNAETRVQLQFDISDMSEMNKIFSRTRKKEVTQDWSQAVRDPHTIIVDLYPEEREAFDKVISQYEDSNSYTDTYGNNKLSLGGVLGLIQKKRQVASSVYGYLNSDNLENGIDNYKDYSDAKFDALLEILQKVILDNDNKLIVFALFKKTLKYLKIRLQNAGFKVALIHGDVEDRYAEIERFKNNNDVKILLSSEVGSEGLDMQFCDALVNYDLPWNPMVVEQRIGRIDRFGQKSPKVNIYNLVVKKSIQEDIYTRLLDRIGIFRGSIGDLEAILDKDLEKRDGVGVKNIREWFTNLERELYSKDISTTERQHKIDAIERAIITEQKNLDQISKGLTDTLTNDVYFRNEVNFIKNNHKYVTEKELINYLNILISSKLSTFKLEPIDEEKMIYHLLIPKSSPRELINFLTEFQPHDHETEIKFRQFINSIRGYEILKLTFSQQTGYENKNLIRINAYHPLIIAALNFFKKREDTTNNTFQFALKSEYLKDTKLNGNNYFLAVYSSRIIKKWINREQNTEILVPVIFDIESGQVIRNQNAAERFLGEAQLNATAKSGTYHITSEHVSELEYELATYIEEIESEKLEDSNMRLETHKKMQAQLKNEFYNNKISSQKKIIENSEHNSQFAFSEKERKNAERILPAQRKVLENLIEEKENVLRDINSAEIIYKSPKLLSINHITII